MRVTQMRNKRGQLNYSLLCKKKGNNKNKVKKAGYTQTAHYLWAVVKY